VRRDDAPDHAPVQIAVLPHRYHPSTEYAVVHHPQEPGGLAADLGAAAIHYALNHAAGPDPAAAEEDADDHSGRSATGQDASYRER
jgi:hypothetical protein